MKTAADPLDLVVAHVHSLLAALRRSDKAKSCPLPGGNTDAQHAALTHLISLYGRPVECELLYQLCVDSLQQDRPSHQSGAKPQHDSAQAQLLRKLVVDGCVTKHRPAFLSSWCAAVERLVASSGSPDHTVPSVLNSLQSVLKPDAIQWAVLVLALYSAAAADRHRRNGLKPIVKKALEALAARYVGQGSESGLRECESACTLHLVLSSLLDRSAEHLDIDADLVSKFVSAVKGDLPRGATPVVLEPWLSKETVNLVEGSSAATGEQNKDFTPEAVDFKAVFDCVMANTDTTMESLLCEIGFALTAGSVDTCVQHLKQMGFDSDSDRTLDAHTVAQMVTVMVRTHAAAHMPGLSSGTLPPTADGTSTWNGQVFAQAIRQLAPDLSWSEVVVSLDNSSFKLPDSSDRGRACLQLFASILATGLRSERVPASIIYKQWRHAGGHMSLLGHVVRNPDVVALPKQQHTAVQLEFLKAPPEDSTKPMELDTWKCIELLHVLLRLSDAPGQYERALTAFKSPLTLWPDVLAAGLLQIAPPVNPLRAELLKKLVPMFFPCAHPNSIPVLAYAWSGGSLDQASMQHLIVQSIIDWYSQSPDDPARLSRILDITHDLKPNGLTTLLLQNNSHEFSLELAALAARREYLKLDKWITDKLKEQQEPFAATCLKFVQRRGAVALGHMSQQQAIDSGSSQLQLSLAIVSMVVKCVHEVAPSLTAATQTKLQQLMHAIHQQSGKQTPTNSAVGKVGAAPSPLGPVAPFDIGANTMFRAPPPPPGARITPDALFAAHRAFESGASTGGSAFGRPMQPSSVSPSPHHQQQQQAPGAAPVRADWTAPYMGQHTTNPLGVGSMGMQPHAGFEPHQPPPQQPSPQQQQQQQQHPNAAGKAVQPVPEMSEMVFDAAVQQEANGYFQQLYAQPPHTQLTVEQFVHKLGKFKQGTEKDHRVFMCMLKNLFEEFEYFHQYPQRELQITAHLFGAILRDGVLDRLNRAMTHALGQLLKLVKRHDAQPAMFQFALRALYHFRFRLYEYPRYCQALAQVPDFTKFPPDLQRCITLGMNGERAPVDAPPPNQPPPQQQQQQQQQFMQQQQQQQMQLRSHTPVGGGSAASPVPGGARMHAPTPGPTDVAPSMFKIAKADNISTLESATENEKTKVELPPDKFMDRIAFLINNLSMSNLDVKIKEYRQIVGTDCLYLPWLAQYLVMKRVSIEPNFHHLYVNLVYGLDEPTFEQEVLKETYRNIKILLRSDKSKAASNFGDRQLVKNLGHWLGLITIAKNKVIHSSDIDLKSLLLEGYYKGQQELLYAVPFVVKVLESCDKSKIYRPSSALVQAILKVLAELHAEPDLKLNLKFEIEVLYRTLDVDLASQKTEGLLKDTERISRLRQQLDDLAVLRRPHAASPAVLQQQQQLVAPPPTRAAHSALGGASHGGTTSPGPQQQQLKSGQQQQQTQQQQQAAAQFAYGDIEMAWVQETKKLQMGSRCEHLAHCNQNDPILKQEPIKKFVIAAIEYTVSELRMPIAERSIKVAANTTERLIRKDFAAEADETRVQRAAHDMMRSLTAGMASITCAEALLLSLTGFMKTAIGAAGTQIAKLDASLIDTAGRTAAEDNLEFAQALIVKFACERGLVEIDRRLHQDYTSRVRARNEGRMWFNTEAQRLDESLPGKLRSSGSDQQGEKAEQNRQLGGVYDEFRGNICGFRRSTAGLDGPAAPDLGDMTPGSLVPPMSNAGGQMPQHSQPQPPRHPMPSVTSAAGSRPPWMQQQQPPPQQQQQHLAPGGGADYEQQQLVPGQRDAIDIFTQQIKALCTEIDSILQAAVLRCGSEANLPTGARALARLKDAMVALQQHANVRLPTLSESVTKAVGVFMSSYSSRSAESDLMARLRDGFMLFCKLVSKLAGPLCLQKPINKFVIELTDDNVRFNLDAIDVLIRLNLIFIPNYDMHLANLIDTQRGQDQHVALAFAQRLFKLYCVDDLQGNVLTANDLGQTLQVITKANARLSAHQQSMQQQQQQRLHVPPPAAQPHHQQPHLPTDAAYRGSGEATPDAHDALLARHAGYPSGGAAPAAGGAQAPQQQQQRLPPGDEQAVKLIVQEVLFKWSEFYREAAGAEDALKDGLRTVIAMMHDKGMLSADERISRFFKISIEMCVEMTYRIMDKTAVVARQPSPTVRTHCFYTLDAFVKLVTLMIKNSDGNNMIKSNMCKKIVDTIARCVLVDHRERGAAFHQLPYHRLLVMLFLEMCPTNGTMPGSDAAAAAAAAAAQTDAANAAGGAANAAAAHGEQQGQQDKQSAQLTELYLDHFWKCLHQLQPRHAPGFAFSWLDLVGHRSFVAKMLSDQSPDKNKTWIWYIQLVICQLKFLAPHLRNIDLPKPGLGVPPVAFMYKGTLRILLVLLHDFPELLCDYHYVLCEAIPPNCVQLRNLVLSAYPRHMRLPDPFMPDLNVDALPEIDVSPKISVHLSKIIPDDFRNELDSYLANRAPVSFLSDLRSRLQLGVNGSHSHAATSNSGGAATGSGGGQSSGGEATHAQSGSAYNVPVLSALVLYVGVCHIDAMQAKGQRVARATIAHTAYMDIYQNLAVSLDTEGRYLFFNAIANQLRYPNAHTHYFRHILLYLFLEANSQVIQEQMTRILFERLVALRPHPWGLLITFIELIKDASYGFWRHPFTRCAPEIERLFQSVAKSCMGQAAQQHMQQQQQQLHAQQQQQILAAEQEATAVA